MVLRITSKKELREAILELEKQQHVEWQMVKEHAEMIYDNLQPANIIRDLFEQFTSSPRLIEDVISSVVGVTSGYISKKIVAGDAPGLFRNILASISQTVVSKLIMKVPKIFRLALTNYMHKFVTNKENQSN